jgi:hypothetical protein
MKPRIHTLQCLLAALLPMAAVGPLPLSAAPPPSQHDKLETLQSVFIYPNNPSEGRDPFFPNSTRVYTSNPENQIRGASLTDLTLKSILGTPPRLFAIINNHTFAVGDDEDVITKVGQRLHIHCVDINARAGTATVEANGMSEVLHITGEP